MMSAFCFYWKTLDMSEEPHQIQHDVPAPVMAPLVVPSDVSQHVQVFSRAQPNGVVRTTISNLPYASVTDMIVTEAGAYTSSVSCACGQSNPDSCVLPRSITAPFVDSTLSHDYLRQSYSSSPYLSISPVQAYLQLRAAPLNK